jgi:hypothetical protein
MRGPGVLDVGIDFARHESLVTHERAPEVELPPHRNVVALQLLRDDLAEQDGLGEVLAAHDHRLPATPQKRQERQERQERQKGQKPETGRSR